MSNADDNLQKAIEKTELDKEGDALTETVKELNEIVEGNLG